MSHQKKTNRKETPDRGPPPYTVDMRSCGRQKEKELLGMFQDLTDACDFALRIGSKNGVDTDVLIKDAKGNTIFRDVHPRIFLRFPDLGLKESNYGKE